MVFLRFSFIALCLLAVFAMPSSAAEMRRWTDSTGQNSLQAEFVSIADGKVTLKGENGKSFEIELKLLSKGDQAYVKALESNPFKAVSPSPFKPSGTAMPSGNAGNSSSRSSSRGGQPEVIKVNRARSQDVPIDSQGDWNYRPAGNLPIEFRPRNITLPKTVDIFEKLTHLAPNLKAKKVAFGYTTGKPGEKATTRFFIGDLTTGRVVKSEPVLGEYLPLALHEDGQHVLARNNGLSSRDKMELSVWFVSPEETVIERKFEPYDDRFEPHNEIKWAEFAANGEFVTCSNNGVIVGWDFETCQPRFHLQASNNCVPAFSPDRTVLAFYLQKQIVLLDVAKRETIGVTSVPREPGFPVLAFSPSGSRIACGATTSVLIWDGNTGELKRDVPLKSIHIGTDLGFPAESFVLLGNKYLVDIDNEIPLWTYYSTDQSYVERGLTLLAAADSRRAGAIYAVNLPHPGAQKLLESIISNPDLVAYRSGDSVKLDVSKIPADHQQEVKEALTKALAANRSKVDDSAPVTVSASITGPTSRKIRFHRAGEYNVQEYLSKVDILFNNERAWGTKGTNVPFMVSLKRGENIGSKLQELGSRPSYSIFNTVRFPRVVVKPGKGVNPDQPTLGSSHIDRR